MPRSFLQLAVFRVLICFLLVTLSTATLRDGRPQDEFSRICPLPKCANCPSIQELRAPGIGLALETSYGTAAVRLHDGTLHHVSLEYGDAPYLALLRRLATGPKNRAPNHLDTNWEKWQYVKARTQRNLNKLVGCPATSETAILALMVSRLLREVRRWLDDGRPIVAAVLTSPERVRLTYEEINDIFDYLKLKSLFKASRSLAPGDLYATSAAYAGYGQRLCRKYIDVNACEAEEFYMPFHRLLHIDYNRESLSGTTMSLFNARDGSVDRDFIDADLGSAAVELLEHFQLSSEDHDIDELSLYWKAVSDRIHKLVAPIHRFAFRPYISKILLTGTSATSPGLKTVLKDALYVHVSDESVLDILDVDVCKAGNGSDWQALFTYATARGAAEVAKRLQEGPFRCRPSDECQQRREGEWQPKLQKQNPNEI